MVVFTCNHCGDSLQKPKVEKHYNFKCRTAKSLTCMDCLKDFRGEEYVNHTKCMTEEERYAAKGTFINGNIKKGEVKQESWMEMIKSIIENETNVKSSIRNLLNSISTYNNVPRKQVKFVNFINSCLGGRANMRDIQEVWTLIETYKSNKAASKEVDDGTNLQKNEDVKMKNPIIEEKVNTVHILDEGSAKKPKQKKQVINEEEININEGSSDKKCKKSRKDKANAAESVEVNNVTNGHNEINETSIDAKENGMKKKSKKRKLKDTTKEEDSSTKLPKLITTNGNSFTDLDGIDNSNATSEEKGMKKKSNKKKMEDTNIEENNSSKKSKLISTNGNSCTELDGTEENDILENSSVKKSKKSKKKSSECVEKNLKDLSEKIDNSNATSKENGMKKSNKKKLEDANIEECNSTEENNSDKKSKKSKKNQEISSENVEEHEINNKKAEDTNKFQNSSQQIELDLKNDILIDKDDMKEPIDVQEKFDFKQKIIEILSAKESLPLKKLEKKVVNRYLKHLKLSESSPKIIKKFSKKLNSLETIEIVEDIVKLKT